MTRYDHLTALSVEVRDRVAVLRLHRPEAGNAFDKAMHDELADVLYVLGGDEDVHVVVLTGAGDQFCSGGDAGHIQRLRPADHESEFLTVRRLIRNLVALDKPLVGAINGDAIGVGATVAVFCDILIGADDAEIVDPHVAFAIAAGDGSALMWALQVGLPRAKMHLFTGAPLPMVEAARIGLVNEALPRADVLGRAMEIADGSAAGPTLAIRGTKRIFGKIVEVIGAGVFDYGAEIERSGLHTEDHREAVAAYFEGRDPRFVGR